MTRRRASALATCLGLLLLLAALHPSSGTTALRWAPEGVATIHPGVQAYADGGQCTTNFVYTDAAGGVYMGLAAHCVALGGMSDVDGCATESLPLGTPVTVMGAQHAATLAYSSWLTMQQIGERNPSFCYGNDFALVKLDPLDVRRVNPTLPVWGGPNGLAPKLSAGDAVYGYGNSELRLGLPVLLPKAGNVRRLVNDGWTTQVNTLTTGVPGDSGSGYVDYSGRAVGVLSYFEVGVPTVWADHLPILSRALAYMYDATALDTIRLANGTRAFDPLVTNLVGL